MIVDPAFFHHWKTRLLIEITSDPAAPLLVLKLWAHCQTQKRWQFQISDEALAIICEWKGPPAEMRTVLKRCGFIHETDDLTVVNDWDIYNRMLVSAWTNGLKGGLRTSYRTKPTGNRPDNRPVTGRSNLSSTDNVLVLEGESEGKPTSFDKFWARYPNKQKKIIARAAWARLTATDQQAVLDGLERWIVSEQWTKDNGQFIPHPSTFLNQRRWEDVPNQRSNDPQSEKLEKGQAEARESLREYYAKKGIVM